MNDIVRVDTERLRAHLEAKLPPKVRRFRLDHIPGVMRSRLGWPVAATLMGRWFSGAGFEISEPIKRSQLPHQLPSQSMSWPSTCATPMTSTTIFSCRSLSASGAPVAWTAFPDLRWTYRSTSNGCTSTPMRKTAKGIWCRTAISGNGALCMAGAAIS